MDNARLGLSLLGAITLFTAVAGSSNGQTIPIQRVELDGDRAKSIGAGGPIPLNETPPLPIDKKGRAHGTLADLDARPRGASVQGLRILVEPGNAGY